MQTETPFTQKSDYKEVQGIWRRFFSIAVYNVAYYIACSYCLFGFPCTQPLRQEASKPAALSFMCSRLAVDMTSMLSGGSFIFFCLLPYRCCRQSTSFLSRSWAFATYTVLCYYFTILVSYLSFQMWIILISIIVVIIIIIIGKFDIQFEFILFTIIFYTRLTWIIQSFHPLHCVTIASI